MAWQSGSRHCCGPLSGQDLLDPTKHLCGCVCRCLPADLETTGSGMDLTGGSALLQERWCCPQRDSVIPCTSAWYCWGIHQCGHRGMAGKQVIQDLADVGELCSVVIKLLWELVYLAPLFGWLLILLAKPGWQYCQRTLCWCSSGDGSHSGDEWCCLLLSCCVLRLYMVFHQHWGCIIHCRGLIKSWLAQLSKHHWPFHTSGWNVPGLIYALFSKGWITVSTIWEGMTLARSTTLWTSWHMCKGC